MFNPETSESYELGMKGDFLSSRLRVNMAVHRTEFEDFQANTFVGTGFVLQNAGEIESNGFEIDFTAVLNSYFTLAGGAAYVDAEYDSFVGGACIRTPYGNEPDAGDARFPAVCDVSGNRVGSTPEWTYYTSLIGSYDWNNGVLYGRLDISHKDDMMIGNDNDPNKEAEAYTVANLHIGYTFADGKYDVSAWAKNIADEDYRYSAFNSVIREGSLSGYFAEPRTYGLTLRANFD